jgi:biopolymer transport protein ExbB
MLIEMLKNGGPVMIPLLICSLVSVTVIIERLIFWARLHGGMNKEQVFEVLERVRQADWDGVRAICSGRKNYMIRILAAGILHRDFSMGKAMEAAAADEVKKMNRYMGVLDTMITVAPLLGILGTVTGIIVSFDVLGQSGIGDPRAVTSGIAEALLTTAAGLTISIFTVFPYNFFHAKIENAALFIEKYATSLEIVWEKQNLPTDGGSGTQR